MAITYDDALSQLSEFSWRGVPFPITSHDWGFRNEIAEHPVSFGKGEFIQSLNASNWYFRYTIPLRQGIAAGNYKDLFLQLPQLAESCRDRTPGDLVDPLWGTWLCKCIAFEGSTDMNRRDGVDARVEFKYAPEIGDIEQLTGGVASLQKLHGDAGALDQAIRVTLYAHPEVSAEPTVDILDAISGIGAQIERASQKIVATLHKYAYKLEKIENQFARLRDPNTFPIRAAIRRNRAVALRLAKVAADPTQTVKTVTLRYSKSVIKIAADAKMTVPQLLELNPSLCRTPMVPAGTQVQTRTSSHG